MQYLVWSLPAVAVVLLIATGWAKPTGAALTGAICALVVAFVASPSPFGPAQAITSIARGAWVGWIVVPYLFGGVLFWRVAMRDDTEGMRVAALRRDQRARRRQLFAASFMVGPFAEAATGFGVGIVGATSIIRNLGVQPIYLLAFSLLSQTMVVWGAMGSGAVVAAAFAKTSPTSIALNASAFVIAFHVLWLPLFWRLAAKAGLSATSLELVSETLWLAAGLSLTIGATALLGPEIAMLAAYGPLIVLRYVADERPSYCLASSALQRAAPFILLITWLVLTRVLPSLRDSLSQVGRLAPFGEQTAWSPLFHAGSWLTVAALVTGYLRIKDFKLASEARAAWRTSRVAIFTAILFAIMAEILSGSGVASALAHGLFTVLGERAVVMTPVFSGLIGYLTNGGTASNGLFMAPQVDLAMSAGLHLGSVIALQHVSGLIMSIFSPVRMSLACELAAAPGREREAFRMMLPFAVATLVMLFIAAALIVARVI